MKILFYWLAGIIVFLLCFYSFYWLFKSFSYWLFYEDMVKQTIHELVKQTALR